MELFGLLTAVNVAIQTVVWSAVGLLAPLFWLWMLIDSLLREEWEYPGATATSNNKLVWVLLIAFVHILAVPYFFMVHAKIKRGSLARPVWVPAPVQVPVQQA